MRDPTDDKIRTARAITITAEQHLIAKLHEGIDELRALNTDEGVPLLNSARMAAALIEVTGAVLKAMVPMRRAFVVEALVRAVEYVGVVNEVVTRLSADRRAVSKAN